jgi:hypothetical protein
MGAPVTKAHPAELVLAVEALHVVTAPVLLDADVAFRAVLSQHRASKDDEVNRKKGLFPMLTINYDGII